MDVFAARTTQTRSRACFRKSFMANARRFYRTARTLGKESDAVNLGARARESRSIPTGSVATEAPEELYRRAQREADQESLRARELHDVDAARDLSGGANDVRVGAARIRANRAVLHDEAAIERQALLTTDCEA